MITWAVSDGREEGGDRVVPAASTIKLFICSAFWRSGLDSAEAVAEMVAAGLAEKGLASTHEPHHHFCVTDSGETFQRLARTILKDDGVTLEWVEVV